MALHAIEQRTGLEVVWASPREVVLWKPAGVASELSDDAKGASAIERVRRAGFARARLAHRLDRITRGLLLIALDDESIAHHNARIAAGGWGKWYLARLALRPGLTPGGLLGEHRAYLRRKGMRAELVRAGGQPSRLTVLQAAAVMRDGREWRGPGGGAIGDALIQLHTGRFHQIRAMMSGLGAPLLGDRLYPGPPHIIDPHDPPDSPSRPGAPRPSPRSSAPRGPRRSGHGRASAARDARDGIHGAGTEGRDGAYLEHFALRFTPCGAGEPVLLSAERFGERPALAPAVFEAARALPAG